MNCPVCKHLTLVSLQLEDELSGQECRKCGGLWIGGLDYQNWLKAHGPTLPEKEPEGPLPAVEESNQAKLCPQCGYFLRRYKVGRGTGISLERCGKCMGIWLDQNEWDVLKAHHLHDQITHIFTKPWQRGVREEERKHTLQKIYTERFGAEDYAKVREIKTWLDQHPERSGLLAYLGDLNPYRF